MPQTIQIADIPDDVYAALERRAAGYGLTVEEFLQQELTRIASHVRLAEYLSGTDDV